MSGTSRDVTVDQEGAHVGVVCLRRPPNNYFDTELIEALAQAYEQLDRSGWCRAIVLASEGRHFCAGLDFAGNGGQDIAALYRAALRLLAAPLPVVAAVQGAAIGGGCGLALSADFRVAAPGSRFSANFARLGFHHGFALSVTLPAVVGRQAAADLLMTGRRVGGEDAHALGLLTGWCPRTRCWPVRSPTPAIWRRRVRWRCRHPGHPAARPGRGGPPGHGARVRPQLVLRDTADFAEGVRATAARRTPTSRGAESAPACSPWTRATPRSPGPNTAARSVPSPPTRRATTTTPGTSCSRARAQCGRDRRTDPGHRPLRG